MLSMKEADAQMRAVDQSMKLALTPEQRAKPACRFFHRWKRADGPGEGFAYRYYQCANCFDRRASYIYRNGYAPANSPWLQGRSWDQIKKLSEMVPTTNGPMSVVPVRRA